MDEQQTTLRIEARMIGKRQPASTPWLVSLTPELLHTDARPEHTLLLRDLITTLVRMEVQAFRHRQEKRHILHILSAKEIDTAARTGKISMGGEEDRPDVEVDETEAIRVALQSFEDGSYLVFLDGQPQHKLDNPIQLRTESNVLFIRLVALVGG